MELTVRLGAQEGQINKLSAMLLVWREWAEGGVVGGEGVSGGKGAQTRLSSPPPIGDPQARLHATKVLFSKLLR